MPVKSKVAVLYTRPDSVLQDYQRLFELAGGPASLDPSQPTILKDNITWHFPMPGANTTPWQLEGTILALRAAGFNDLVCVQNQTVVTNAFKGEDLNGYVPIFKQHDIPVRYNFRKQDMTWVPYKPKASMLALDHIYPEGIHIPDFFIGKNIVHLPHHENPYVYHHNRGDEKCLWWAAQQIPALHPHLDPRDPGGPAGNPERNSPRDLCHHGWQPRPVPAPARA